MGRSFYFSHAWAEHAERTQLGQDIAEDGDPIIQDHVAHLKDPETGEDLEWRLKSRPGSAIGLFDDEVRAGANLLNQTGMERDYDRGTITQEFTERDSRTGEIVGTREVVWEKTSERTMVIAKSERRSSRRYFT